MPALDADEMLTSRPVRLTPEKEGEWVGPEVLEKKKISCPYRDPNSGPSSS